MIQSFRKEIERLESECVSLREELGRRTIELHSVADRTADEQAVLDAMGDIQTDALRGMRGIAFFPALIRAVNAELARRGVKP